MIGEVVSSHYEDLGAVEPDWIVRDLPKSIRLDVGFETAADEYGVSAIKVKDNLVLRGYYFNNRGSISAYSDQLDQLGETVAQVDDMYRQYREIDPKTKLRHTVTYKTGRQRTDTALHSRLLAGLLPVSGPSRAHFDGFIDEEGDAVMMSHGGTPSRVSVGPVRKFVRDGRSFGGALSKPFVPATILVPQDHAILFNRNTLHRQSGQVRNPFRPAAWFRSIISVVQPSPNLEPFPRASESGQDSSA